MKSLEATAAKLADKILLFLNCSKFQDIGVRIEPREFEHAIPLMLTSYLSDVKYLSQAGVTPGDVGYACDVSIINDTADDILFGNVKLLSTDEKLPLCHQYDSIDLRGSIIARYTACDISGKTEKVKKASRNYCSWNGTAWVALSSTVQYKEIAPTYRSIEFPKTLRCSWADPGGRYHEYGHGLDQNDGGNYDNPSEAYADVIAIIQERRSCVGRGFFQNGACSGYGDSCLSCTGIRDMDWGARISHTAATPQNFTGARCGGG